MSCSFKVTFFRPKAHVKQYADKSKPAWSRLSFDILLIIHTNQLKCDKNDI